MINNIYELSNGKQYVIILEENIDNKKYVLMAECDYLNDELKDNEILIKEVVSENNSIKFKTIDTENIGKVITKMVTQKINNEELNS